MKIFNKPLSWIHKFNYQYDEKGIYNSEELFIQPCVLLTITTALSSILFIATMKSLENVYLAFLPLVMSIIFSYLYRIPYKKGKLDKYMSEEVRNKKAIKKEEKEFWENMVLEREKILEEMKKSNEKLKKIIGQKQEQIKNKDNNEKTTEIIPKNTNWRIPHLKVLGLNEFATQKQIKMSYRKLAMKWHPDRNFGNKQAEEKFKEMKNAYESLK